MATRQLAVEEEGYYFSPDRAQILQVKCGDVLPDAHVWEYLGRSDEMTPADAVAVVEERYPDISVELTFRDLTSEE